MEELNSCTIEFTNEDEKHFRLEINLLEENTDNYSMWLSLLDDDDQKPIFSTWIDSGCGEVKGNQELYTDEYGQEVDKAYKIFGSLMDIIYGG